MTAKKDTGWADGVYLADKNWQFTIGYYTESGEQVIYERRSNLSTEHNAEKSMEASWKKMFEYLGWEYQLLDEDE